MGFLRVDLEKSYFLTTNNFRKELLMQFAIFCRKNYLGSIFNSDVYIRGVVSATRFSTISEKLVENPNIHS